jgi:hypothetical protein
MSAHKLVLLTFDPSSISPIAKNPILPHLFDFISGHANLHAERAGRDRGLPLPGRRFGVPLLQLADQASLPGRRRLDRRLRVESHQDKARGVVERAVADDDVVATESPPRLGGRRQQVRPHRRNAGLRAHRVESNPA